jgi:ribosomal subunit interface protein
MFQKFEVQGIHATNDKKLYTYVTRKIGGLDRYMPRGARPSAHAEVHLKESKSKVEQHSHCEVTLYLPQQTIVAKESALNMFAAIDITEAKLKAQLKKYKELHGGGKLKRHLFNRFRKRNDV